ncbi:MAG: hypothetical protein JSR24_05845 [Proteobacteria bacterium]|nr:hypothetical protein [Pseudomonadota bacterium]
MPDSRLPATRHRYGVYGLVVESELSFASVEEAAGEQRAALRIVSAAPEALRAKSQGLVFDPEEWVKYAVMPGGGVYMRVDGVFEAAVSPDGREVACARIGDVDQRSFEAHLLNFALSASLTLQGEEVLHSTVIEIGGRAVGLLGSSGAGKSTLAAALIATGAELVTDDMLRLVFTDGVPIAQPGAYRLKLFDGAARRFLPQAAARGHFNALNGKVMIEPRSSASDRTRREGVPLAALVWIGNETPPLPPKGIVTVRRLAGMELAKVLISCGMSSRYQEIDRLARQMAFAGRVAAAVPVIELRYTRDFAVMDRLVALVRDTAAGKEPS